MRHTPINALPSAAHNRADEMLACNVREVVGRIGDRWSVLVIIRLARGVHRFRELQRAVPGISQRMLTLTLRRLQRDSLIHRTVFPTVPTKVEYELTRLTPGTRPPVARRLTAPYQQSGQTRSTCSAERSGLIACEGPAAFESS